MKIMRVIIVVLLLVLIGGSVSVEATRTIVLPANLPWSKEVVDSTPYTQTGQYVSIAHHPISGAAYISYYNAEYESLYMAREVSDGTGDCYGNDGWDCTVVSYGGDVGRYSSIDVDWVVPGLPEIPYTKVGISFFDADQKSLMYAELRKTAGDWTDWTIQEVDDYDDWDVRGTYSSLKFNSDHDPIIAYHYITILDDLNLGGVKIASYNSDETGYGCYYGADSLNWDCERVSSYPYDVDYGSHVSLDLSYDDTVHLAFYDSINSKLVWAYLVEPGEQGSCNYDNWDCITVDNNGDVGKFVSIHAPKNTADKLRFAYFDNVSTMGKLKYAVRATSGGNCTSTLFNCFAVDDIGNPLGHIGLSITVDNQGYPIIAYMDSSSDTSATKLKVARPALAYWNTVGNCGGVPPGGSSQYWQCELLDPGYRDIVNEAAFADVSVSPDGLASIAYYEYDSYGDVGRLKVAQQRYMIYLPLILK